MGSTTTLGSDLCLKNKRVYDNPKYFDPKTGNEYWPGQNGDPNLDGFLNGEFKNTKLQSGKKIDRFGSNYGSFFGEVGDSRELRAMSPNSDFSNYNQYEVLEELPVREGKIAPWFDEPGGGRQYKLDSDFVNQLQPLLQDGTPLIDKLIELGYLRRI